MPLMCSARSIERMRSHSRARSRSYEGSMERTVRLMYEMGDSVSQCGSEASSYVFTKRMQITPQHKEPHAVGKLVAGNHGAPASPPPYGVAGVGPSSFRPTKRMGGEPAPRRPVPSSRARQQRAMSFSPPRNEYVRRESLDALNELRPGLDAGDKVAMHQREIREQALRQLRDEDVARAQHERQLLERQRMEHASVLREQVRHRQAQEAAAGLVRNPDAHANLIRATSLAMNPELPQYEERTAKKKLAPPPPPEDRYVPAKRQVRSPCREYRSPRVERSYSASPMRHSLARHVDAVSPRCAPYDTYDANPCYPEPKVQVGERAKFTHPKKGAPTQADASQRDEEGKRFSRRIHPQAYKDTHPARRPSPPRGGRRLGMSNGPHQTCPWG